MQKGGTRQITALQTLHIRKHSPVQSAVWDEGWICHCQAICTGEVGAMHSDFVGVSFSSPNHVGRLS